MNWTNLCAARADAACKIWALTSTAIALIDSLLLSGLSATEIREHFNAGWGMRASASARGPRTDRQVAVIPIRGLISHRPTLLSQIFGGTATRTVSRELRQALDDPSISSVMLDVDSPGGTVEGTVELADEIYKARGRKRIVAAVNATGASAAYWIASQATEVNVTPSGQIGSIGVVAMHEDISKAAEMEGVKISLISAGRYKTEANPFEALGADAREAMQAQVNFFYSAFVNAVARGRGVSASQVREGFGQGRMVSAQQAVDQGMADRVATSDHVLSRLSTSTVPRSSRSVALLKQEMRLWIN